MIGAEEDKFMIAHASYSNSVLAIVSITFTKWYDKRQVSEWTDQTATLYILSDA